MGNLSGVEIILVQLVLLAIAAIPIALVVWAVRRLSSSRQREAALLRRIEALEADRHAPR
jgi:flagellar biogenesis protein FliO